ncbi:M56 family metallopeptidase [Heliorestis convoluta]|uniref:Putative membrane protein n=1 Tax=Heliorestis convoluta TaxID=356322 RepID=A0A5Q2N277_9FIRM|nr:M56 family metallopeptidase [Heliorestis convoluta]QGG47716.1 putative membrane protein [Heliorestis convoluta]
MLSSIYSQLLTLSIVASGLYLLFKLVSPTTLKHFSPRWHYLTYLLAYTFFLIPYHMFLPWLDLTYLYRASQNSGLSYITEAIDKQNLVIPQEQVYVTFSSYYDFLPHLMIAGTLIFLTVFLIQNYQLHRRIFRTCRLSDNRQALNVLATCKKEMNITKEIVLYQSSYASTPFLYGLFKPCIVLPDIEFAEEELKYVLQHELTHWKHKDNWLKVLLLFINALHWFNPIAYMARRDMDRFCELNCDRSVIRSMNFQEKRRYCELILNVLWNVADKNAKVIAAFSNEKKLLERRIEMILQSEGRNKVGIQFIAIVITVSLAFIGVVSANAATERKNGVIESTIQQNITTEVADRSSFHDKAEHLFLDSYDEANPKGVDEWQENKATEEVDNASAQNEMEDIFLDSYYEKIPTITEESQVGIMAVYSINNWNVPAHQSRYGVSRLSMTQGAKVPYDITWSPQPGVIRVGLYNHNTGRYYWATSSTRPPLRGTITVLETGLYSFAIGNGSDRAVLVNGSFTY